MLCHIWSVSLLFNVTLPCTWFLKHWNENGSKIFRHGRIVLYFINKFHLVLLVCFSLSWQVAVFKIPFIFLCSVIFPDSFCKYSLTGAFHLRNNYVSILSAFPFFSILCILSMSTILFCYPSYSSIHICLIYNTHSFYRCAFVVKLFKVSKEIIDFSIWNSQFVTDITDINQILKQITYIL